MRDLQIGDQVKTMYGTYETVHSFGHHHKTLRAEYLQIHTDSGFPPLELSKDHMVMVEGRQHPFVPASSLRIGDSLVLVSETTAARVKDVKTVVRHGMYAPFTSSGTIVVNGVVASSYVSFQDSEVLRIGEMETPFSYQWLAHSFETPHRMYCLIVGCKTESYTSSGISHWVFLPWRASQWLLGQNEVMMQILLVPFLGLLGVFWIVEKTTFHCAAIAIPVCGFGILCYVLLRAMRVSTRIAYTARKEL